MSSVGCFAYISILVPRDSTRSHTARNIRADVSSRPWREAPPLSRLSCLLILGDGPELFVVVRCNPGGRAGVGLDLRRNEAKPRVSVRADPDRELGDDKQDRRRRNL